MKLIRQHPESGLCVACCLAMVVNESVNYVLSRVHLRVDAHKCPRPYVPIREAIRFLYEHDLAYGAPITFEKTFRPDTGVNELVTIGFKLTQSYNALLSVKSETLDGALHMVVWNHEELAVFDPQYDAPRSLSEYAIVDWCNLVPLSEI